MKDAFADVLSPSVLSDCFVEFLSDDRVGCVLGSEDGEDVGCNVLGYVWVGVGIVDSSFFLELDGVVATTGEAVKEDGEAIHDEINFLILMVDEVRL